MGYGFEPSLRPNMVALCGCIDGHNIIGRTKERMVKATLPRSSEARKPALMTRPLTVSSTATPIRCCSARMTWLGRHMISSKCETPGECSRVLSFATAYYGVLRSSSTAVDKQVVISDRSVRGGAS